MWLVRFAQMPEQGVGVMGICIQAQLHALSLLFEASRHSTDIDFQIMLARMLAEDTQHLATLLERATRPEAGPISATPLRKALSITGLHPRKNVLELLALSLVAQEHTRSKYASAAASAGEEQERQLYIALRDDEARHVSWLKKTLQRKAWEGGTVQEVGQLIHRCREIWRQVEEVSL